MPELEINYLLFTVTWVDATWASCSLTVLRFSFHAERRVWSCCQSPSPKVRCIVDDTYTTPSPWATWVSLTSHNVADPGPEIFPSRKPGSASKNRHFKPPKWFLSSRKYDPGCSSRIRIRIFYPSRIQRSKHRISDPDPQHWHHIFCFVLQGTGGNPLYEIRALGSDILTRNFLFSIFCPCKRPRNTGTIIRI